MNTDTVPPEGRQDATGSGAPEPGTAPASDQGEAAAAAASNAWREVLAQMDALGEAIGRWARAAVNDPDNRRHAQELKDRMNGVASQVGTAMDDAMEADVGRSLKEAGEKMGDAFRTAGDRFTGEVAPRMASAFRSVADSLHGAASRMEDKGAGAGEESAEASEAPSPEAAGDAGERHE